MAPQAHSRANAASVDESYMLPLSRISSFSCQSTDPGSLLKSRCSLS